ncbi:SDR family NAD(P)-dependent oxidoreductase [uncultured Fructobacillus sp.]|uniref:SDR family NAD(P)-dependent oxidoreductase n=1 Tax=uncultured Fructobacillus sp. TaxID=591942 RepID=UPI002597E180|nr:glucose 1-dehydrogenase [uncultured Fructobacillus sp.]
MTNRLKNKVAIVTGGISGIGRAIAEDFLAEGAQVVITGRRESLGVQVASELGKQNQIIYLYQDISNEDDWNTVVEKALSHFGHWDILVNNAGIGGAGKLIVDTSLDEWQKIIDVNLTGTFLGNKIALQKMDSGSIVNVSSVLGIATPMPGVGAYAASKGGTRALTKSAAVEAIKMGKNIRVNSIHPSLVDTDIVPDSYREGIKSSKEPIPLMGKPIDIAKAVTYVSSDEASYTTGAELVIDGGVLAGR